MLAILSSGACRAHRNFINTSLLCLLLATAVLGQGQPSQLASANATAAAPQQEEERFSIIVVFRDLKSVLSLRAICHPSAVAFRLRGAPLGLPSDCHMPGICRRVYSTAIFGFSGEVTESELSKINKCLPRAVWYRELDATVHKAEDSSKIRKAETNPAGVSDQQPCYPNGATVHRRLQQQEQKAQNGSSAASSLSFQAFSSPNSESDFPQVHSFEAFNASRSTNGPPIDINNITGGVVAFSSPGEKKQSLGPILWNLDRIDQRQLPLDNKYTYGTSGNPGTGTGVTIYVIDSGIIPSHQEFQKAGQPGTSRASFGYDFVMDQDEAEDCDGHGTHVSATAAGLQVGIAKDANIVAVRILDCTGAGTISDTVAALDWVAANAKKPAVATLSLGIQVGSWSRVLEDAVRSLVNNHGVIVVVASGNSAVDACYVAPANVPEVITVAATDVDTKYNGTNQGDSESMYKWSNTGPCVDIFAPGVDIYSACGGYTRCEQVKDDAYTYASGTSMAVPTVAGVAALYLESNPGASPSEVAAALTGGATQGLVKSSVFKQGTPNRLLYSKIAVQKVSASNGP